MTLSNDVSEYLEDFGLPAKTILFPESELGILERTFPSDIFEFLRVFGRSLFEDGRLQTCHFQDFRGVLSLVFGADKLFSHQNSYAYAYSSFGTIYFWNTEHGFSYVDLVFGQLFCRNLTKNIEQSKESARAFITPFGGEADFYDHEGKSLFKRALKTCGQLEIGECYGFVPALALGGVADIGSVKRLSAAAHFAILAQAVTFNLVDVQGYGKTELIRKIG